MQRVLKLNIKPAERLILLALYVQTQTAAELARELHLSRQTVTRALNFLQERHYINVNNTIKKLDAKLLCSLLKRVKTREQAEHLLNSAFQSKFKAINITTATELLKQRNKLIKKVAAAASEEKGHR
jgi:DNA-binding MarR family transcriptional regulator